MNNEEAMCYITYAVPAKYLPGIPFRCETEIIKKEEPDGLFPEGFMPEWFLRGAFPEDDFEE